MLWKYPCAKVILVWNSRVKQHLMYKEWIFWAIISTKRKKIQPMQVTLTQQILDILVVFNLLSQQTTWHFKLWRLTETVLGKSPEFSQSLSPWLWPWSVRISIFCRGNKKQLCCQLEGTPRQGLHCLSLEYRNPLQKIQKYPLFSHSRVKLEG